MPGPTEPLIIAARPVLPYRHAVGQLGTHFFRALKEEGLLLGQRCGNCGRVWLPPRPACGRCRRPLADWIPVGPGGELVAFTIVRFGFVDPATGYRRPVPYGYGMVRLDGAWSSLCHFLSENDPARLQLGMRVEAVLRPATERVGALTDLLYFTPVREGGDRSGR